MIKKKYICPVCGFDQLNEPPYDDKNNPSYEICSCCGFEFGVDEGFKGFRACWIEIGAKWFVPKLKPREWNVEKQLKNII